MSKCNTKAAEPPPQSGPIATTRARIDELVDMILRGAQTRHITGYIREQEALKDSLWFLPPGRMPLPPHMVRKYTSRAGVTIARSLEQDKEKRRVLQIARRELLYGEAVMAGDVRTAFSVLESLGKLEAKLPDEADDADPD